MTTKSDVPLERRIKLTDSKLRANLPRPLNIAEYFAFRDLNDLAGIVTLVLVKEDNKSGHLLDARSYVKREGSWVALSDEPNQYILRRHRLLDVYNPGDPVYDAFEALLGAPQIKAYHAALIESPKIT